MRCADELVRIKNWGRHMKTIKSKLDWPANAFSSDGTASDGSVSLGLGQNQRDVCLVPFLPRNAASDLSVRLGDLFRVGDYLQFDSALLSVRNRKLSAVSLAYWLDKLMVVLMFVTGNKDQVGSNIFDTSLQTYENPGSKADFPYGKPLKVIGAQTSMIAEAGNPHVVVLDEATNQNWAMSLEVFSHAHCISVASDVVRGGLRKLDTRISGLAAQE